MIIDRATKSVIATPTKTGTVTMGRYVKARPHMELELLTPYQHRMIVPDEFSDYTRYMLVRNPFDRLVSLYHFLHLPYNRSQWASAYETVSKMSFHEFVVWWLDQRSRLDWEGSADDYAWWRSPNTWLVSLAECVKVFDPDSFIRMESMYEDLFAIRDDWGNPLHNNRSTNRVEQSWEPFYSAELKQLFWDAVVQKDFQVIGLYPRPTTMSLR